MRQASSPVEDLTRALTRVAADGESDRIAALLAGQIGFDVGAVRPSRGRQVR